MGNTRKLPEMEMTPEVIQAIDEELAYQATLPGSGRADSLEHGVAGQLVTLSVYTREAEVAWTKNKGDEPALDALRKVAAIAVRALIQYGCPRRNHATQSGPVTRSAPEGQERKSEDPACLDSRGRCSDR